MLRPSRFTPRRGGMPVREEQEHSVSADLALPIVVGAGLDAERRLRPLAYALAERIRAWQDERGLREPTPIVCTDLWFLNDPVLCRRPALCIGAPETNAAVAYLASRLPTALLIENILRIQADPEYVDLQACVWGVDADATARAVAIFDERFLEPFLEAIHELPISDRG